MIITCEFQLCIRKALNQCQQQSLLKKLMQFIVKTQFSKLKKDRYAAFRHFVYKITTM